MGDRFDVYAEALPLVVTTCPPLMTKKAIARYTEDYLRVLAASDRYVSIVDARLTRNFLSTENRNKLARFGVETRALREAKGTAIIVLTGSVLVRASIRTMHWQAQTGQPTFFVATEEGAIERALAVLAQHGVPKPSEAVIDLARERLAQGRAVT
jgi:hypothetical protein